jgi:D-lactate dehydrogenase (cytochrome)
VARIELLDEVQVRAEQPAFQARPAREPLLLLEFHGTEAGVKGRRSASARSRPSSAAGPFDWATKAEERTRLWQARHDAYWAARS